MSLLAADGILTCPNCAELLDARGHPVRCPNGHSFDVSRQGYLNLLGRPQPRNADTGAMLAARDRFLSQGHYRPIADALTELTAGAGVIVDAGAGSGYYLSHCLQSGQRAVATDVSVSAARRAARIPGPVASVVADTWLGLPIASGVVDVVLSVFAPRNFPEFRRVLQPSGELIVVTPAQEHLAELRDRYQLLEIESGKIERISAAAESYFHLVGESILHYPIELSGPAVRDLIEMGPNAFHRKLDDPAPARTTVHVHIGRYTRK